MFLILVLFGNYLDFTAKLKWLKLLYKFKVPSGLDSFTNVETGKLDLGKVNFPLTYIKHFSTVSFCCKLCRRRDDKIFENVLEKGLSQLKSDFDYKNILDKVK